MITPKDALKENANFQNYLEIGFPDSREHWRDEKATYVDGRLMIAGHPVMEDWEDGYMRALAETAAAQGGRVLELGFGMGISAGYLQQHALSEHVIVEANADVFQRLRKFAETRANVTALFGFWQDVLPTLPADSFDGILFDTYPVQEEELAAAWFFFPEAHRLLKPGGVFTYFSDEAKDFSPRHRAALQAAGFGQIEHRVCAVTPPKDCLYWSDDSLVVPIIRK